MTHNSVGMWRDPWQGSWGLPFIWTALPDYGGDQGIKGNMSEIQGIPFDAPPLAPVPEHMRKTFNPATQVGTDRNCYRKCLSATFHFPSHSLILLQLTGTSTFSVIHSH